MEIVTITRWIEIINKRIIELEAKLIKAHADFRYQDEKQIKRLLEFNKGLIGKK